MWDLMEGLAYWLVVYTGAVLIGSVLKTTAPLGGGESVLLGRAKSSHLISKEFTYKFHYLIHSCGGVTFHVCLGLGIV